MKTTLKEIFIITAQKYSKRIALWVNNTEYTYEELLNCASKIAQSLCSQGFTIGELCAIMGGRAITTYTGMLATMLTGGTYIPCNIAFPPKRNLTILKQAKIQFSILDSYYEKKYAEVLAMHPGMVVIVDQDNTYCHTLKKRYPQHTFVSSLSYESVLPNKSPEPENLLYILFTSGSTGIPKGVTITHKNICSYLDFASKALSISKDDHFVQIPELTFDLSVHPIWLSLIYGAKLYVPNEQNAYFPSKFLKEHAITQYASTTSTVNIMRQLRACPENSFPSIRCSMFCGERLPVAVARDWQKATPNATLWNFYGPTEATCACLYYKYAPDIQLNCDSVPIGLSFTGMEAIIVDSALEKEVDEGELLLSGNQLSPGYFENPQKNSEAFFEHDYGNGMRRYYRTGDIVKKTGDGLIYIGRNDFQIKYRGYRIELSEIEVALQKITKSSFVCVLPMPYKGDKVEYIQAYLSSDGEQKIQLIKKELQKALPAYMIPEKYIFIDTFPVNINGKIDRDALALKA